MIGRNLRQVGIILFAIVAAAFLFLWSVTSAVDFLLKMRRRLRRQSRSRLMWQRQSALLP
jgi:hypothetical protein